MGIASTDRLLFCEEIAGASYLYYMRSGTLQAKIVRYGTTALASDHTVELIGLPAGELQSIDGSTRVSGREWLLVRPKRRLSDGLQAQLFRIVGAHGSELRFSRQEVRSVDRSVQGSAFALLRFKQYPVILSMSADSYSLWVYYLHRLHGSKPRPIREKQRINGKTHQLAGLFTFFRSWNVLTAAAVQAVDPLHDRVCLFDFKLCI